MSRLSILLLACLVMPVSAVAQDVQGRYTQLLFQSRDSASNPAWTDLNRLRLEWQGNRGSWSWQLSYDHQWLWGGLLRDPLLRRFVLAPEATWLDAADAIHASSDFAWGHRLYRGWMRYERSGFALTVGRQRIAWGSGRIWNPTDRFNPVSPTALEPDQKLGVDALDVQWRYSAQGGFEGVLSPGRAASRTAAKWALRWSDTFHETDLALLVGRIGPEHVAGMDVTGNWHDASYRLEWLQSWRHGRFGQLSTGVDYTWVSRWFPAGLYLAFEYFYNGAISRPARVDRLQTRAPHLFGLLAGYDLTPLWRLDGMLLLDPVHGSAFLAPRLTWSVRDNVDAIAFVQLPWGGAGDEFSGRQRVIAAQIDWYFDL